MSKEALVGRQTPWAIGWVGIADSDVDPRTKTDGQFRSESDEGLCCSPERIKMDRRQMDRGRIYRRQIHRRTDLGGGGAEGSRTPDLLIANETLYQLSYDPVPKCARRCRFGDDVARTGFRSVGFFGFLWTWALVIAGRWRSWTARSGVVGLGGVGSGAEVGSGFDDPPHLVEPPGSPFATTGSEASDAPRCSTEGHH